MDKGKAIGAAEDAVVRDVGEALRLLKGALKVIESNTDPVICQAEGMLMAAVSAIKPAVGRHASGTHPGELGNPGLYHLAVRVRADR